MKKILLSFLLFTELLLAQDAWRPVGPDDLNQASYNVVMATKMISKNNNLWVLNHEILANYGGDRIKIHWYDGLKWHFIDTPFRLDYYKDVDLVVDSNNVPYISCTVSVAYSSSDTGKLFIKKFNGTAWVNVGPDQFVSQGRTYGSKLAIDSTNKVYVTYYDLPSYTTIVKRFNGASWELVGGSPTTSSTSHVYTDKNDVPFLTYQFNNLLYVKKFDGVNWVDVGVSGFPSYEDVGSYNNQRPLIFDGNNTPYIAYCDNANSQKLSVRKFNGTNWEIVGSLGFTTDPISYPSISIDNNNVPYVAFKNAYYNNHKANAVKFNGSSWVPVGNINFSEGVASYTTMAFDNNNTPFVCYTDNHTQVQKLNGSNWESIVDAPVSKGLSDWSKIVIDANNVPYVAYKDMGNAGKISVKRYVSGNWEVVGSLGFSEGEIWSPFLKFDNNNIPYIAYVGSFNNGKINVKKFNGTSWEAVGAQSFSPDFVPEFYLNFDQNNTPYIIYKGGNSMADNPSCSVHKFNGTDWQLVGGANFSGGSVRDMEISFDTNNNPIVVYSDANDYFGFRMYNGSNWVVNAPAVPMPSKGQIDFDNYGTPYLSYLNATNKLAIKKKISNGSWILLGQDGISTIGNNHVGKSMVFDSENIPYVLYAKTFSNSYIGNKSILSVQKFDGTNWQLLGFEDIAAGTAGQFSLAVKNGIPYVSYGSRSNDNGLFVRYFGAEGALSSDENVVLSDGVTIFPNPVKNTFSISGNEIIDAIEIHDVSGKRVLYQQNPKSQIDIEDLPSGFYISKIKTERGISTVKLIKE